MFFGFSVWKRHWVEHLFHVEKLGVGRPRTPRLARDQGMIGESPTPFAGCTSQYASADATKGASPTIKARKANTMRMRTTNNLLSSRIAATTQHDFGTLGLSCGGVEVIE